MNLTEELKDLVCEINMFIDKKDIPLDEGLVKSGILDSYGLVELIAAIEEKFDMEFAEEDMNVKNLKNLNAIAGFIKSKINIE